MWNYKRNAGCRMQNWLRAAGLAFCILHSALCISQINTDRVMLMGRSALYYEDYVLSIQRFNMVISAKPYWAEPYFYRALAKFYLEDYLGAEMDCGQAIERNPYAENHFVLRGLCRVNLHHYDTAEEDYRRATSINPLNTNSWHNMVLCQMEQKAYERADSALDVMLRQWPKEAENFTMKAQVCFAREDTVDAERWLDRALETNPYEGPAWSMKAMVTLNRGDYKTGEEQLDKAILQLPRHASLFINRALARFHQQNLRGAMTDYDTALEIEPGNYLGHFNRGLLRAQVGEDNLAIEDFNFVLEQEPDNTIALYNRALLLDQTGDYKGALRDITEVLKDYPEFWTGYQTRAAIRRKMGDVYGAERDEFKVLKAQMDKRAGVYKSAGKTRKKSDCNPEDFNKLVEADQQQEPEKEYLSEYRGRVQDKQTQLAPLPLYVLTYYPKDSEVSGFVAFHLLVETLNNTRQLPRTLSLATQEKGGDGKRMDVHFSYVEEITRQIGVMSERPNLYLYRALSYYHLRDFDAAISDLDRSIALDSLQPLAYFLRAQIRCARRESGIQTEIGSAEAGAEEKIAYGLSLEDLKRVVNLQPDMTFAYYNMAGVYLRLHDYDKARACYDKAIEGLPQFPAAWYNRGVLNLLDGRSQEGLNDLSHAGEYGLYSAYNLIKRYTGKK